LLTVVGLTGDNFRDISFALKRGEILGFAGAEGNGQRNAIRALGGLQDASGSVLCDGKPVRLGAPAACIDGGLLFLSADRATESVFPELGVRENMTLQVLDRFARKGIVSARKERDEARGLVQEYGVVTPSLDQPISGLSGGNQQKSVLARSFLFGADVVLIDEPTQGVDVGAKADIHVLVEEAAAQGAAVVVSTDHSELTRLAERVVVLRNGRVADVLARPHIDPDRITAATIGQSKGAAA